MRTPAASPSALSRSGLRRGAAGLTVAGAVPDLHGLPVSPAARADGGHLAARSLGPAPGPGKPLGGLLEQAFGLERLAHRRPLGDPDAVGGEHRPGRKIEAHVLPPAEDGEEIAVGHGEALFEQVGAIRERLRHEVQALRDALALAFLGRLRRLRVEERREGFVQLGRNEAQPLEQAIPCELAWRRREPTLRHLIGDPEHDRDALGQALPVVELEDGHVAFGVDRLERLAIGGLPPPQVHPHRGEGKPASRRAMCGESEQAPGE